VSRVVAGGAIALALAAPAGAGAWAPASSAPIHPGVQTYTKGAQCTANFIFARGGKVYVGQAAHCAGTGSATETNGCKSHSLPLGTPVRVHGARQRGTLVYSSWRTMQRRDERTGAACRFNDLALVKLARSDVHLVNPSVPGYGGPTGVASFGPPESKVYSYGNSGLRAGVPTLSPKEGVIVDKEGDGWSAVVYTATPGVPGDSGSGFMDDSGRAIGVLSTLNVLPNPGGNGVGALANEIAYMHRHGHFDGVHLVEGTRPFRPDLVQAIAGA
jgi:hypothetical protein